MQTRRETSTWMRCGFAAALTAVVGPGLVVAAMSYGLSLLAGVLLALVATMVLFMLARRITIPVEAGLGVHILFSLWVMASVYGGYRMTRLAIFMHDATESRYAYEPRVRALSDPELTEPFLAKHNCFTCYMVAAELASRGDDNIYSPTRYHDPETETQVHKTIGDTLHIDRYQYPPPFLLLPGLLRAVTADFFHARALWFGINGMLLTVTFLWLVVWVDRWTFRPFWLLWPALLVASTVVGTLQIGNAHLFIVLLTILAFLAFETRRFALGGALLGFGVVGKIFPGVLLLYLLIQRRWRAVIWTSAAMMLYTGASFFVYGIGPYEAFLTYQIPRLASGEAFSFAFKSLHPIMVNGSILGIAYKLASLGWVADSDVPVLAKTITWTFSAVLVVSVMWLGIRQSRRYRGSFVSDRHGQDRLRLLRIWIVFVVLAQLRSPFLPWGYGNVAPILLIFLALPLGDRALRHLCWVMPLCFMYSTPLPLAFGPATPAFDLIYSLVGQAAALSVCAVVLVREAIGAISAVYETSSGSSLVQTASPVVMPVAALSKVES